MSDGQLNYREQNIEEWVGFLLFDHGDTIYFSNTKYKHDSFFFIAYKLHNRLCKTLGFASNENSGPSY